VAQGFYQEIDRLNNPKVAATLRDRLEQIEKTGLPGQQILSHMSSGSLAEDVNKALSREGAPATRTIQSFIPGAVPPPPPPPPPHTAPTAGEHLSNPATPDFEVHDTVRQMGGWDKLRDDDVVEIYNKRTGDVKDAATNELRRRGRIT
jgi:hypothetical protein